MTELIVIAFIIGFILFAMWLYKSVMIRQTKLKLGITQILNDGSIVEAMDHEIIASSQLPFDGDLLASFFATYLTMRESKGAGNWSGLISTYLFQWEVDGLIKTSLDSDGRPHLTFNDVKPTTEIELELYDILKSNHLTDFDYDLLKDWSQKVLALGEQALLELGDIAFDQKGRIRFTREGYDKSLSHGRFAKYWMDLSLLTFNEFDQKRQQQELSFALLLELTDKIQAFVSENSNASDILQIANQVWRF